jgi:hypothetical protein
LNEFDSITAVPAARKGFIACAAEDAAADAVTGVWFSSTAKAAEGDASDAGVASESTFVKGVATSEGADTGTGGVPVGMFGAGVPSPNAANAAEGEYPPGVASCTTGVASEGGAAGNGDCPGVGNGEDGVGNGSGVRIGAGVGAGVQRGWNDDDGTCADVMACAAACASGESGGKSAQPRSVGDKMPGVPWEGGKGVPWEGASYLEADAGGVGVDVSAPAGAVSSLAVGDALNPLNPDVPRPLDPPNLDGPLFEVFLLRNKRPRYR